MNIRTLLPLMSILIVPVRVKRLLLLSSGKAQANPDAEKVKPLYEFTHQKRSRLNAEL